MERRCMRPAMHSRNTCSARMVMQLKSKCGTSTWSAAPSLYSQVESSAYLHARMHANALHFTFLPRYGDDGTQTRLFTRLSSPLLYSLRVVLCSRLHANVMVNPNVSRMWKDFPWDFLQAHLKLYNQSVSVLRNLRWHKKLFWKPESWEVKWFDGWG